MADYYLRGPINQEEFLLQARNGRVPFFAVLGNIGDREYIFLSDPRDVVRNNIIIFRVATISNTGVTIRGQLRDRTFFLNTETYSGVPVLVPSAQAQTFTTVLGGGIRNFAVFLAGVPFTLLNSASNPVSAILSRRVGNLPKLELVSQFYALPTRPYFGGRAQNFPAIIDLELSWSQGLPLEPLFTNALDSVQAIPYNYCKTSLCAPDCKGGCSLSNEVCLFDTTRKEFACLVPSESNIPFYQSSLFIAGVTTLAFVLFLSLLLLGAIVLIKKTR
ncbi:Transmembrane domain-containing protein [Brazilian cedratvirus IHUMI]|uniref:Transmembrane domain-containing protein n=1 Tax=Brazilian cedratvirus IHUMI TaxID=2126980 RepID=A0A2R8FES2_9VIRU|nr:Transmembrane domain-containing protein [Brazilian cedratvirus IHUMI]